VTKIDIKMKKTSFACFILTTLTMTILLAVSSLARTETTKKFEPGQLREDFQLARQSLEEGHPGLYRHTKKVELDRIRVSFPSEPQTNETDDMRRRLLGWHFLPQSRSHVGVGAHFFNQQTSAAGIGGQRGIHGRACGNQEHNDLAVVTGFGPGFGWRIAPCVECPS